MWIIDDYVRALDAFLALELLFKGLGMEVNIKKTKALFSYDAPDEHLVEYKEVGMAVVFDGLVILGTPVGNEDFIRKRLEKEADVVLGILDKIARVGQLGKLNKSWATVQAIYHLLRDCANQMLRHLLRTVEPRLTVEAFEPVDARTLDILCGIFDINGESRSDFVKVRMGLPGRFGGLGVMTYEVAAYAAYLGAIRSVWSQIEGKH